MTLISCAQALTRRFWLSNALNVLATRKPRKVIHVTHIRCAQYFRCKMIQRIQIHIGEKLAGEIADRQATPA